MNIMNTYNVQQKNKHQTVSEIVTIFIYKSLLAVSVYLLFGLLFQFAYAEDVIDPYQSQHGSVWLLPDNGVYLEAMQMQTDVDFEITGAIARATVRQNFRNDSSFWCEGIYVFPLPENAAVDRFRMIIGERIIEGQIKERVTAKKIYQQAKAAGKKTSLIEQQRPNVFTTSLANIAPGEEITVEFEYQQVLEYRDNSYRLRYPMVVGPRYHAADTLANKPQNNVDDTSVFTETDPLNNNHNPTRIHIMLDAGVSLAELKSSYHKIHINQTSETRYSIATIGKDMIADRDFELVWQPDLHDKPQLSAFNEKLDDDDYTMVTLLPPDLSYLQQKVQARDIIFVLDVSGSMSGTSIEQAKASLITALGGLTSIDRFNIIWFNDKTDSLFPEAVTASGEYKDYAKQFIKQLQASGGTEMLPALKLALSRQETFSRFRQVVFLTDGNINNETQLFDIIDRRLGNSRLFTIGIGSAPNSYFMRKAANKGRGTFTYIGDVNEVQEKTLSLLKKLESPALINIQLLVDSVPIKNSDIEMFPEIIPDLYGGEPLTIFFRAEEISGRITLIGDYGNEEWQTSASLNATTQSGISIAWAREKIASLMSKHHETHFDTLQGENDRKNIQQQITSTALKHHLVSRYTSLVAVDVTPTNESGLLYREQMKNNPPHGWKKTQKTPDTMLAQIQLPQTASNSRLHLLLAIILFISAALLYRWRRNVI